MIAYKSDQGSWPFAARKPLEHKHGAKTTIHVVAQENRHDTIERLAFHVGLHTFSHLSEQVVTPMNIAHAVYSCPIWDTPRRRCSRQKVRSNHPASTIQN